MAHLRNIEKCVIMSLIVFLSSCDKGSEHTRAEQSSYNQDIGKATTSSGISKADMAWHAQNTFGWDCTQVVSQEEPTSEGYFFIKCSNGKKLRVYPRNGTHPKITNESGGYN